MIVRLNWNSSQQSYFYKLSERKFAKPQAILWSWDLNFSNKFKKHCYNKWNNDFSFISVNSKESKAKLYYTSNAYLLFYMLNYCEIIIIPMKKIKAKSVPPRLIKNSYCKKNTRKFNFSNHYNTSFSYRYYHHCPVVTIQS